MASAVLDQIELLRCCSMVHFIIASDVVRYAIFRS